jgi:hypothetical protein
MKSPTPRQVFFGAMSKARKKLNEVPNSSRREDSPRFLLIYA